MILEDRYCLMRNLENCRAKAAAASQFTRVCLIEELTREFSLLKELPTGKFTISIRGKYSHKLVKSTLQQIGFKATSKKPDLLSLSIKAI